jgi:hypothetical protein
VVRGAAKAPQVPVFRLDRACQPDFSRSHGKQSAPGLESPAECPPGQRPADPPGAQKTQATAKQAVISRVLPRITRREITRDAGPGRTPGPGRALDARRRDAHPEGRLLAHCLLSSVDKKMREKKKNTKARALARPQKKSLLRSKRGGTEFIEKVIMIGLFALVAAVGVTYISQKVTGKFAEQGNAIESEVHSELPADTPSP